MNNQIILHNLELFVHLGWPAQERQSEQKILVDISLRFPKTPEACLTDDLADTCCYDSLVRHIKQSLAAKNIRLLEHLGHTIYETIKSYIAKPMQISLRIKKHPEIPNLAGGVSFCYGDENIQW